MRRDESGMRTEWRGAWRGECDFRSAGALGVGSEGGLRCSREHYDQQRSECHHSTGNGAGAMMRSPITNRQRGLTLIESIMFIIVVGLAWPGCFNGA